MSEQQPVFAIEKIYVKDLSLEIPHAPQIFLERESPQIDIQLHTEGKPVAENIFEVVLTVTVTAKFSEKTLFLVEAAQAGIFQIQNVPETDIEPILGITCPNILFPYARETVSDVITRAGFLPVILSPMSFEALYQQRQQAVAEQEQTTH
ncbi:MAG: protein-export chaperone SecB [Burkholderiales bacterium]|nr:protein-export chaperone SecB [Burkholderiales bacterium]